MPVLRPAWQAGSMRNPREGTSLVLRDTTRLTWWCVCSCCATSSYREVCRAKGGIGSGETLCHDIYPAWPITTVSLATNTYCMMDGHSSCAPRTVDPGSNLAVRVNRAIDDRPGIQQDAICYQWFKQRLIPYWASLNPVLANSHRLNRAPSNHLCLPDNLISEHTPL